jgi:hypothetical protein
MFLVAGALWLLGSRHLQRDMELAPMALPGIPPAGPTETAAGSSAS